MIKSFLSLFFFFFFYSVTSQQISGVILGEKTGEPLVGASVYFNNTTLGTTTNFDGEFTLEFKPEIKTPLIISFIGFETEILYNFSTTNKLKIYLNELTNVLNEVVLSEGDDWSRALKLQEFRKNYLGESEYGLGSKILNEDDIILKYNSKTKQLSAQTALPIIIESSKLQYLITVELKGFKVNYSFVSKNKKRLKVGYVYYSGRNFYKSMRFPTKNINDKRLDAYYGSTLHFMRALARKKLDEEGYKLYIGNIPYKPEKFIRVSTFTGKNDVTVRLKDRFSIVYKNKERSSIEGQTSIFFIDSFGNHTPPDAVRFGGDFGKQRMGDSLPLDFLLTSDSDNNNSNTG